MLRRAAPAGVGALHHLPPSISLKLPPFVIFLKEPADDNASHQAFTAFDPPLLPPVDNNSYTNNPRATSFQTPSPPEKTAKPAVLHAPTAIKGLAAAAAPFPSPHQSPIGDSHPSLVVSSPTNGNVTIKYGGFE